MTNHEVEMPVTEAVPAAQNGQSTNGMANSKGAELNAQLVQENVRLARENAELVRANEELANDNRLFQAMLDTTADRIFFKDTQSRFLNLSGILAKRLGVTDPKQVIGKTDFDFQLPERAREFYEDEQRLMRTGEALVNKIEKQVLLTGEIAWTSTTKMPLRDKQGAVVGLMGINRDITELKRTEEDLRRTQDQLEKRVAERTAEISQERLLLRMVIDNLPDYIYAKDKQGHFVLNNMAHAKSFGTTPLAMLGKSDFDFHPPELAAQFSADEKKMLETGESIINQEQCKCRHDDKSGKKYWSVSSKVLWHDAQGRVMGTVGISRDTTEQKQAETRLANEQQLFQALLETMPDAIYFKDRESRFVRVSQSKAESTLQIVRKGHRDAHPADAPDTWPAHMVDVKSFAKWLIGKTDFDTYTEEHARAAYEDEQEIIRTGKAIIGKLQKVTLTDGEICWLLSTKMPWQDREGNITGVFGISQNVTQLKQAEETLDRERLLLRTVIDNLPDYIYAKDREGHFVLNNQAHAKSFGHTPLELLGKSDFDFHPPELAKQFFADEQKIIESGQPVINQEQYKCSPGDKTGIKRWSVSTKVLWRDDRGAVMGTVGITRNIHEMKLAQEALRQSEERLREVMRRTRCILNFGEVEAPEGWREHALDEVSPFRWNFPVVNVEAAQDVFPLDLPPDQQYQQIWTGSRHPEDFKHMNRASGEAFLHDAPFYRNQFRCKDKHGVEHWMQQFVTINKVAENKWQLFGITTDITDLKETESALRSSEEKLRQFTVQLERSNRELQDFAYVASHDLQEPLRKIVVFGERLKEKYSEAMGAEALDYLDRMQKAAARMQTLISDLLTFSRVTTKAQPFKPVNLAEVAAAVVDDLEGRIELVKGRVEVGPLPVIDGEALQMRQLLQNLIGNALKFRRPEEPPMVKVEAEIIPAPDVPGKKLCRLTVADNCIGFDEKYLDRIFNVFQRLHTRNEYEGTGMGLAIVRKIALYHGGDVTARSKPGQGSTFILTLPVDHPKEAREDNTETTTKKESQP
jgi:PAS domain S-box-containing protein